MRVRSVLLAASALSCMAFAAFAAEGPASNTTGTVEEVVVTGEKYATTVQKAPYAVTVLDQEKLKELGATSFSEYAGAIPALSYTQIAPGENIVTLRGVQSEVTTALRTNLQKTTGVYLNDVPLTLSYATPDLDLYDVSRVEVLKGPQGTLYGDGSVGGLIRIITNQPDPSASAASVEGTYGFVDSGKTVSALNGMVNIPIVQDKLALRVVGQYKHDDGWIDDVGPLNQKNVNSFQQYGFRAALRWQATPDFAATLSAITQHQNLGASNDYQPNIGDLEKFTTYPEPINSNFNVYNGVIEWNLGWANLTSSTSYLQVHRLEQGDITAQISQIFGILAIFSGEPQLAGNFPSFGVLNRDSNQFSQEVRLVSPQDRRLKWIGGFSYDRFTEHDHEHDSTPGFESFVAAGGMQVFGFPTGFVVAGTPYDAGPGVIFDLPELEHRKQTSIYGEATYDLTSSLAATGGVRYYRDSIDSVGTTTSILFPGTSPFLDQNSTSDDGFIFRGRLQDQINPDLLVYALVSQGFRSGGLNPLNPGTAGDPNFPRHFNPDKLINYELGWKSRWADGRLTLNGALFYIDWSDMQMSVALPTGFAATINAKSRILGAEADLLWKPVPGLSIGLNGSLLDAELRQAVNTSPPGSPGDQLLGSPKAQGYAFVQYDFPAFRDGRGYVRADVQAASSEQQFFGDHKDPNSGVPGSYGDYAMFGLRAGADWDGTSITVFAKNLTNERAALFRNSFESPISQDPLANRDQVFVAQPRTIGVTISKTF